MSLKLSKTLTNTSNLSKSKSGFDDLKQIVLSQERKKILLSFQKNFGIRFKSLELLNLSFVHRSVSNESGQKINNERLEFLGDAILGAITATLLYRNLSDKPEGDLAKIKSIVVSEEILSGIALELQLDTLLILGKGEELTGGRSKKAILADALEALLGAIYLDCGYKEAFNFLETYINAEINKVLEHRHYQDYKSLLQEYSQRYYRKYPVYTMVKKSGPEHSRIFWVEVSINGNVYGPVTGKSKKSAEQDAAKLAYEQIINSK